MGWDGVGWGGVVLGRVGEWGVAVGVSDAMARAVSRARQHRHAVATTSAVQCCKKACVEYLPSLSERSCCSHKEQLSLSVKKRGEKLQHNIELCASGGPPETGEPSCWGALWPRHASSLFTL